MDDVIHDCAPAEGEATGLSAIRDVLTVFENTIEDGAETEDWDRDLLARALAELEALTNPAPVPPASAEERMREALEGAIAAWESLPEGRYSPLVVQAWLFGDMLPAINRARAVLPPKAGGDR